MTTASVEQTAMVFGAVEFENVTEKRDPVAVVVEQFETFRATVPAVLKINTEDELLASDGLLKSAKRLYVFAEDTRKELVGPLNGEVKRINETFRQITGPLESLESTIKAAILEHRREQQWIADEARRVAEAARLAKEAELRAEAEKQARQAEENRLEAERKRREAEELEGRERAALLRSAAADEARAQKQDTAATESAFLATAVASVPVEAKTLPKIAGTSVATTYKTGVTDKAAFVRWALENGGLHFLDINIGMLDKMAATTKGAQQWPGVEVQTVEQVRSSRK